LAASRSKDIADAHVIICARRHSEPIVTSDPEDLRRLDPQVRLITV
jgi:predicted nucleic acid-binding protein